MPIKTLIMKINRDSDLEIIVHFNNDEGTEIPVPDYDFDLLYYVNIGGKVCTASKRGGTYTNCHVIDGTLHVFFDDPQLERGRLRCRSVLHIPDSNFGDGVRDVTVDRETSIIMI